VGRKEPAARGREAVAGGGRLSGVEHEERPARPIAVD
jgi:hypothetical protein